jgi:hypothetical protein
LHTGLPFKTGSGGFPDQRCEIKGEKVANSLDGKIRGRQRGNDPGIIGVLTLARQYRRHAVAPDLLDRGQDARLVVDQIISRAAHALPDGKCFSRGNPPGLLYEPASDLRKADTAQEILKTRVGAERIEGWP